MSCSCGHQHTNATLLAESDADKEAIADLTRQAKAESGPMATLIRARRDQLKAEVKAEEAFAKALKTSAIDLSKTIEAAINTGRVQSILGYNDQQLLEFILQSGLGLAVDEFIEQTDLIRQAVQESISAIKADVNFSAIASDMEAIQAITAQTVFDDVILPPVKKGIAESLRDVMLEVPSTVIASNLQLKLERSTGRQLTQIKTEISSYGRSINAAVAEQAGLDHYLYTGPKDGITRPFCRQLINLVVDKQQMNKLNNGQGLSVLISGGGYNCRHSWSPVSEGFIEAANLTKATSSDITRANAKAKR
jgi:vacuolar-type H+-ATPase subunit I/STV1|tara:strand:- start:121 stop:1041 length:921 start_codon:yes stop_codon:yes gene_type:complete